MNQTVDLRLVVDEGKLTLERDLEWQKMETEFLRSELRES